MFLKIGEKKILNENCVKFLGVLLNSNLSRKHHIAELCKKLARTVGIFYKTRCLVDTGVWIVGLFMAIPFFSVLEL